MAQPATARHLLVIGGEFHADRCLFIHDNLLQHRTTYYCPDAHTYVLADGWVIHNPPTTPNKVYPGIRHVVFLRDRPTVLPYTHDMHWEELITCQDDIDHFVGFRWTDLDCRCFDCTLSK